MDMFSCIASVSDLLTSKSKLVLVDNRLSTKSCLFRQCRDRVATVIGYTSSTPEVLVIILGLGTEIRKADLATHKQFLSTLPKFLTRTISERHTSRSLNFSPTGTPPTAARALSVSMNGLLLRLRP